MLVQNLSYQPGYRNQTIGKTVLPRRKELLEACDLVTFSGKKADNLDIEKFVTVINPEKMPAEFIKNTKKGIKMALLAFPEPVRKAILEDNPRFVIGFNQNECMSDKRLSEFLDRYSCEEVNKYEPYTLKGIRSILPLLILWDKGKEIMIKNLPDGPLKKKFTAPGFAYRDLSLEEVKEIYIIVFKERFKAENDTPYYIFNEKTLVLPFTSAYETYNKLEKTAEFMAILTKHELFHYVNYELGPKLIGRAFSEDEKFRKTVLKDKTNAQKDKTWPAKDATENGCWLGHYYLYNERKDEKGKYIKDKDTNFSEAFAEVGNHLLGGGVVNADLMNATYKLTAQHIAALLKKHFGADIPVVKGDSTTTS